MFYSRWRTAGVASAVMVLLAASAVITHAQRGSGDREHIAGRFDFYQLVLSWSPTHCAENSRGPDDTQCGRRRARPYAFVLHGLWPQYERGYPEFCRTAGRPYVPESVINGMLDIMPSRGLVIHQYRKHGTCADMPPALYFKASRIAYNNVKIPPAFQAPKQDQHLTARQIVTQFLNVNPALKADAVQVVCRRGPSNQLQEVKICMTRKGEFRSCVRDRAVRHRCSDRPIHVPPVRP